MERYENYVKQSYRNRCEILTSNGILPLIIPIKRRHGEKMPVKDVRIDYDTNWQTIHWRAISAAYSSSPFFNYYIDDLLPFYENREEFLFDFNLKLIFKLMEICGISTKIEFTSHYESHYEDALDFRTSLSSKSKNNSDNSYKPTPYYQVFRDKANFQPNLSILDLVCNEGNNSWSVLKSSHNSV
jgi:hypothetical protein